MQLPSMANKRLHWRQRAAIVKQQRKTAFYSLSSKSPFDYTLSKALRITLTRFAPRQLDSDNLAASFKAVRDGVADWLRVDDGHTSLQWIYGQQKRPLKDSGIQIEIEQEHD